jgi:nucleotide-binding universal stress UspA family protein
MPYKDILVQTDVTGSASRCEIAAVLAARGGGQLTGLYLTTPLFSQFGPIGSINALAATDVAQLIRDHIHDDEANAARAAMILTEIAAASKVACECRAIGGDSPHDLIHEARHADLVVLGPLTPFSLQGPRASPIEIALDSGSPILIVPSDIAKIHIGKRVLVAWNGSREAARALRDALPMLSDDCVVEIRIAQPKHDRSDAGFLRRHLERHGYRVNLEVTADEGQSISAWLVGQALEADCDLVIMGLDVHKRLQELVLGRVSRELLYEPPLPLLISH